jgi:hypothetical protein
MTSDFANAAPTKDLFVDFLTKDLTLAHAITDLVDNSVDGARRLKPHRDLDGLYVNLNVSPQSFEITDNCGGIPVDVARRYAFRFGRPPEESPTPRSVGQFGVGMKRALFKLGKQFTVTSTAAASRFVLNVEVDDWKRTDDWQFEFQSVTEGTPQPPSDIGTTISVTQLLPAVAEAFTLDNFRTRLANDIRSAHQQSVSEGLTLRINGIALPATTLTFRQSTDIQTAHKKLAFGTGSQTIRVNLYVGVADSKPTEAGWYIFCNGRLLLDADQTSVTGWGEHAGERIPKYHNQYATFRGIVYFDCEDTSLLPWNTTKTGVDAESPVYQTVREEMIFLMRRVIDFLNEWDKERTAAAEDEDAPLTRAISAAPLVALTHLRDYTQRTFSVTPRKRQVQTGIHLQRVQYDRPLEKVLNVKQSLNAISYKQVGELTFDYYYKLECEE